MLSRPSAASYICRSCRAAAQRSFSTTTLRPRGYVPNFTPTPIPELDDFLADYRERLFVPASLSQTHQRLIYRPTRRAVLLTEQGVTVSISDEEEVQLKPTELTDRPKTSSLGQFARLLGSTNSPEAWQNLFPFLKGLVQSKRPPPQYWFEYISKLANRQGMHHVVMDCIEHADATNARLSDPFTTRRLLIGCHERAVEAGFDGAGHTKALVMARRMIAVMEKPEHCGRITFPRGHHDMRQSLFVNACMLELQAGGAERSAHMKKETQPEALKQEVQQAVTRVLVLSENPKTHETELSMPEFDVFVRRERQETELSLASKEIIRLTPLYSGLKFALRVPGAVSKEQKKTVEQRLRDVEARLRHTRETVVKFSEEKPDREALVLLRGVEKFHGKL